MILMKSERNYHTHACHVVMIINDNNNDKFFRDLHDKIEETFLIHHFKHHLVSHSIIKNAL